MSTDTGRDTGRDTSAGTTTHPTAADRFRAAVAAQDLAALEALFTEDVRLNSPVKSKPFEGKPAVMALFRVLLRTFEGFHYVGHFDGSAESGPEGTEGPATVLPFRTVVNGRQVHGIDMLHLAPGGLINEITVMIRPQTAVMAVGEAVLAGLIADGILPAPPTEAAAP
ncbi:nuclear transport factor 2 family protein [Streptomyces sp. NPDC006544]|uniref:nuclear transport factor 2 family protein n=1 Tax=Streptomyces sp. NPDC006544 TaxID=3154583 RepID=UPI0033ADCA87